MQCRGTLGPAERLVLFGDGASFGGLGARREMMIGFLAEPAMLMTLFTAAFISGSTQLPTIVETLAHREFAIYPSLAFAGVAFTMVSLAENARIPVDNPATHLELTMIHEAMVLEYSGPRLALVEWSRAVKQFLVLSLVLALVAPVGLSAATSVASVALAIAVFLGKLGALSVALALVEVSTAKLRERAIALLKEADLDLIVANDVGRVGKDATSIAILDRRGREATFAGSKSLAAETIWRAVIHGLPG